ncbi:MAG: hypothetical protein ABR518_08145 [Actinomycetota bacterium]
MTRLLGVEVRRYLSRRLVRVVAGLAVVGILTGAAVMFVRSHRVDSAQARAILQAAEAQRDAEVRACASGQFGIRPSDVPPGLTAEQFCEQLIGPPQVFDRSFHLTDVRGAILGVSGILISLALLLGASFIGAEWHHGTMTTLLTWEPRRVRVFASKIAVVAAMAFAGTVMLLALLGGLLAVVAAVRGTTVGADTTWLRGVVGIALRSATVAATAAVAGGALASIGRNTTAGLGVAFGYLAVLEPLVRGLRPGWGPWLIENNLATFLEGTRSPNPEFTSRSVAAAGLVVGAYALGLAAAAAAAFRARDVT